MHLHLREKEVSTGQQDCSNRQPVLVIRDDQADAGAGLQLRDEFSNQNFPIRACWVLDSVGAAATPPGRGVEISSKNV